MSCIEDTTHYRTPQGYAQVRRNGKLIYAHRLAFFEVFGWWPPVVRHTCDNPPCVNIWHLLPGTQADNVRDMVERGRRGVTAPPTLNPGMPDGRTDYAAYDREMRRRKRAGTWVTRKATMTA